MSNYPQDKFTAPDLSGKWRYWGNNQSITSSGDTSAITKISGVVNINQDNLFINYENKELGYVRIGVLNPSPVCVNGKTDIVWSVSSMNTKETQPLGYFPYCYKNGKPTKMISSGPTNISTSKTEFSIYYYEKL